MTSPKSSEITDIQICRQSKIGQEKLPSTSDGMLSVVIYDIVDPHHFSISLSDKIGKLDEVMDQMQVFYDSEEKNRTLQVDIGDVEVGNCFVSRYEGKEWHRIKIIDVNQDGLFTMFYVDYGTVTSGHGIEELLYLIKQFADLPCQGFLSKLADVSPDGTDGHWTIDSRKRFFAIIRVCMNGKSDQDGSLVAIIKNICEVPWFGTNLVVSLIDTFTNDKEEGISIAETLLNENLARTDQKLISKIKKNPESGAQMIPEESCTEQSLNLLPGTDLLYEKMLLEQINIWMSSDLSESKTTENPESKDQVDTEDIKDKFKDFNDIELPGFLRKFSTCQKALLKALNIVNAKFPDVKVLQDIRDQQNMIHSFMLHISNNKSN